MTAFLCAVGTTGGLLTPLVIFTIFAAILTVALSMPRWPG